MTPPATARVRPAPVGPAPGLRTRPQSTPRPRRAPAFAPRMPRRVSGPARLRRAAGPALALSELPLLDRLIKGRTWIGLVAFALIGIVTMQLGLLKLNAGIGRALVHEAALERENSALSVEASEAQDAETVELQAGRLGMQLVAPGTLQFLPAEAAGGTVARAVAALNADAARAANAGTAGAETAGAEGSTPTIVETAPTANETPEAGATATETAEANAPAATTTEASTAAGGEAGAATEASAAAAGESSESSSSSSAASGASVSSQG